MILSRAMALTKDKWITVTKYSRLAKPQPRNHQGPLTTNQYAILAEASPTSTTHHHQACPVLDSILVGPSSIANSAKIISTKLHGIGHMQMNWDVYAKALDQNRPPPLLQRQSRHHHLLPRHSANVSKEPTPCALSCSTKFHKTASKM